MSSARIALVSFDSLGDSLIYLMMAENLQRNRFDITCYGNALSQMSAWIPHIKIRPLPPIEELENELAQYHLAIVSPSMMLREKMADEYVQRIRRKWVLICQKAPRSWYYDHTQRLKSSLPVDIFVQLHRMASCGGSIRFKKFFDESVVEITQTYMRERMGLEDVVKVVSVTPPVGLKYRRFPKRVIVSPDSAGPEKKNWSKKLFIRLAHLLKAKGYEPVIVVSPRNHEEWYQLSNGSFDVPHFSDISQLASFIYESGALVANDSGNGHLASFLNIPVVTIYRKRNKKFHWRPGWGTGVVICPSMVIPWIEGGIWKPFVRPVRVLKELENLLSV